MHTLTSAVLSTATAEPGDLTVPDVTVSFTAPAADATVTTYTASVVTTATLVGPGDAETVCNIPHADAQSDGISATVVGAGGPTTSSNPACRPPDVCATTTTTSPPAPTITSVAPSSGPAGGGTSVTITGTDLTGATDVNFGATPAASFTVDTPSQITATSPAHAPGTVDVTATTASGTSGTSANDEFTYVATPTITSVSPSSGPAAGGTSVTITGTDLTGATDVNFGVVPAASFTVDNATQITATSPAHAPGLVDVTATTPNGTSPVSGNDEFTFLAAPTITSVSPTSGPSGGGTSVIITGTDLTGATDVSFGATPAASFTVDTPTQITATSPAHLAATVDITATTAAGTSATSANDEFTFVATPTITSVSPASGPAGGGTSVTITGTALTGATDVSFGATPAASFTVDNDTQITATSPAHAAATVDVTATTPGGTTAITANDEFTFESVTSGCSTSCIGLGDASQMETDAGHHPLKFAVTLSEPATQLVTVDYTVTDGTATGAAKPGPGDDYKIKSGTLKFKPSAKTLLTPISKTIAIQVYGDTDTESNETFSVTLSNPTGGYTIGTGTGTGDCGASDGCATGTILNDDGITSGLTLGVGDGSIVSAHSGKQKLKLPVTLSDKALTNVTVDYTVTPGTATYSKKEADGGDFGGKLSGTLTFKPGATLKPIAFSIWADPVTEPNQDFTVTLSNVNGNGTTVTIVRASGTGTILGLF